MKTYRTQSLFIETNLTSEDPLYTLKPREHKGLPSLYLLYMEANDPFEQAFALKYIPGGFTNWKRLCNSPFFKPHITRWREELDTLIRAQALLEIRAIATTIEGPTKYQANKFLLEGQWNPNKEAPRKETPASKNKVGRPSTSRTQDVLEEADRLEQQIIDDHFKNLQ